MPTLIMQSGLKAPSGVTARCTFSETLPTIVSARFEFADILDEDGDPLTWTATPSAQTSTSITVTHVFATASETPAGTRFAVIWLVDGSGNEYPCQRFTIRFT